ncbi:hypothetical protein BH23CHL5_BH23CHL5_02360 [soil metagenome]
MPRHIDETLERLVSQDRQSRRRLLQSSAIGGAAFGLAGLRVIYPFATGVKCKGGFTCRSR